MKRLILAAALLPVPAFADATSMCLDRPNMTDDVCACATDALALAVSEEDRALYDAIGTLYLPEKAAGTPFADAWDMAVDAVAAENGTTRSALQRKMNPVGRAHRDAIEACE
ncbi:hypothetical protein [Maritimibacter dapengensis]|uniref:HdeA/HdeB family protein n=1 Tax=Maritimibacter dapengensis TaxID=2836868 RepID=A0ABS6SYU1_9RHOB|nr:hypothetical protein [Maritimibacter dapengensis]MBV7378141.1 hypothetical protein [Maritimibacter dapengensis]